MYMIYIYVCICTAIGLFPDVGSTSWLSKLDNGLGEYIGNYIITVNSSNS